MDNPYWAAFTHAAVPVHAGSKHPVGNGWQSRAVTTHEVLEHLASGGNLGIKCDQYPGIDIDISDPSLQRVADSIAGLAHKIIGPAPVRGRADAPSRLLLYSRAGDVPRNPIIEFHDRDGVVSKIELRAGNTQSVVHGVHPQGARYDWDRGFAPPELHPLTFGEWEQFRKATCDYLKSIGHTVLSDGSGGGTSPIARHALGTPEHLTSNAETFVALIESRPNTHERFPTRNSIVHYLAAAKSALGTRAEDYRDRLCLWAIEYDGKEFTPGQFDVMWDSIRDSAHGARYVEDVTLNSPLGVYVDPATRSRFNGTHINDLPDFTEPHDFVENLMCTASRSVLFGRSNTGKSLIAVDMGMCVATPGLIAEDGRQLGFPFAGHETEHGGVAYFLGEGQQGMRLRLQSWKQHHGFTPETKPHNIKFEIVDTTGNLLDDNEVGFVVDSCRAIKERLGSLLLVIIDTLACAMPGGDENTAQDMTRILKASERIVQATGAHVMLVHHEGKTEGQGARGHSSLRAAVDTEINVKRKDIHSPIEMIVTKQRDLAYAKTKLFDMLPVTIMHNGEPVLTRRKKNLEGVIVVPSQRKVEPEVKPLSPITQVMFDIVMAQGPLRVEALRTAAYAKWKEDEPDVKHNALAGRFTAGLARLQLTGRTRTKDGIMSVRGDDFTDNEDTSHE